MSTSPNASKAVSELITRPQTTMPSGVGQISSSATEKAAMLAIQPASDRIRSPSITPVVATTSQ